MNEAGKNIIQQLFGQTELSGISRRDLETIAARFPYFGPAQFLLAKKLQETNSNGTEDQLQKTALYFTNPYWLNYLLSNEGVPEKLSDTLIAGTLYQNTEEAVTQKETEPEIITAAEEFVEEPPYIPLQPVITESSETLAETKANEENSTEIITPPSYQAAESISESSGTKIPETDEDDLPIPDDETAALEDDAQRLKLSSLIKQHLSEFKKPVEEIKELPVKPSPYHTIDYFASQGIKADGQDKLATRVRKFTDWLKQMKGVNPQPTDLGTDAETEHLIETIAQSSNETKDIVTEAMAEVLVKQGKTEKAVQLYKKLSFLNPAKSIYFAAKIDDLNKK